MERCDICASVYLYIFDCLDEICTGTNLEDTKLMYFLSVALDMEQHFPLCSNWTDCDSGLEYEASKKIACDYLTNKDILKLKQALQYWRLSGAHDKIFSAASETPPSDFSTVKIVSPSENVRTIYLDFNIYDKFEKSSEFSKSLIRYAEKNDSWFVYGAVHLDEVCRMNNSVFEELRIKSLQKITNNREVIYFDDNILFCFEDILEVLKRARNIMAMNNGAENLKFVHSGDKNAFYMQYIEDVHMKKINNLHIVDFEDEELNSILRGVISSPYNIEELRDSDDQLNDRRFVCGGIRSLYEMLDTLGFYSDKKTRTIRSSVYDIEHLCYASKCDYFVTADKRLLHRAKEIYSTMGIATNVTSFDEFSEWLGNPN